MLTLLPVLTAAALLVTLFAVVAVRANQYQPATVDPFGPNLDPSADTLAGNSSLVRTHLNPPAADPNAAWHTTTLDNLTAVEDLLDSLEAHGVKACEVATLSAACFSVRWK